MIYRVLNNPKSVTIFTKKVHVSLMFNAEVRMIKINFTLKLGMVFQIALREWGYSLHWGAGKCEILLGGGFFNQVVGI